MTKIPVFFTVDAEGRPVLAVEVNDFVIHEPFSSECGRFSVDPLRFYDIPGDLASAIVIINNYLERGLLEVKEPK